MLTHYPTNAELVANLEPDKQEFWLKILNDMDKEEANYQRKIRYHQVSSLDFIVSNDGRETTLQELIQSNSCSGEDYTIMEVEEQLYCEALDEKHRIVFKAIFENGLNATKASQLVGRSDKTAKKYYKEACKQVLKKIQS